MRVGLVTFDLNNLGGIITYVERLAKGLQEAGHSCDILKMCHSDDVSESHVRNKMYTTGETDLLVHPIFGWSFPAKNRIPYKGDLLSSALERLATYDLLIWETPAPSLPVNRNKRDNLEWLKLFGSGTRQIITIHDGNLLSHYPHLAEVAKNFPDITLTAPHPRGYISCLNMGLDQSLIMIPQYPADETISFEQKQGGFVACQIFKAWKHVDEVVRAISYLPPVSESACKVRVVAGNGLNYHYMISPDKCKFYHPPTAPHNLAGKRIWDTAVANGMIGTGPIGFKERDEYFVNTKLFLDPSWLNDDFGHHLNGVVPEAMRLGCVPVGKPKTFRMSEDDTEAMYQPKSNYLEIPQITSDEEYAEYLEYASTLPKDKWESITQTNYGILRKWFDYRVVTEQLINQAFKGVEHSGTMRFHKGSGIQSDELLKASARMLETFGSSNVNIDSE